MRIKLLIDIPIDERHGLKKDLELRAEPWPFRKKGSSWWRVIAPDSEEVVGILRKEAEVVEKTEPERSTT